MAIYIRKVVMLGDPAVGKTSLVHKYVNDMFDDSYLSTIGAKPVKKTIERGEDVIILIIWDIAGHNYNLHPAYYLGAKGALLVCDLTRLSTVDSLQSWILALQSKAGDVPIRVLANKADLENRAFELEHLEDLGFVSMMTSAKTGANVEKAFNELAELIVNGSK